MPQNLNLDGESPDFSNYFKKSKKSAPQNYDPGTNKNETLKKIAAVIFCILSLAAGGYATYLYTQPKVPATKYEIPEGYKMVAPANEPPKLEKIK